MAKTILKKSKNKKSVLLARKNSTTKSSPIKRQRLVGSIANLSVKRPTKKSSLKVTAGKKKTFARTVTAKRTTLTKRDTLVKTSDNISPSSILPKIEQQQAQQAKYHAGRFQENKRADEFQFPVKYGDNKIVVMVRDPWWLYSYWEITPEREGKIRDQIVRRGLTSIKSMLRVYDVTGIGEFNGANANSFFDIELKNLADTWYINVCKPNRLWIVEIGILADNKEFFVLARSNCITTPRFGMSEIVDEEWMSQEDDYWKMFGLSGGYGFGKGSLAFKSMFRKILKEQVTSGGWSGTVSSLSSPSKKQVAKKGFWLVVDAELIVYGQTEPNAKVTVQKTPIRLRKDGTFTMRFALPDGKQEIPVCATSFDGDDTRTITPIVTRRTL